VFIGLDDTDSPQGMCTTYLAMQIARAIQHAGGRVSDMQLVRLNPTIPYKTRGNAALCIEAHGIDPEWVYRCARDFIVRFSDMSSENTNPGLVICSTRPAPDFYQQAVTDFCTVEEARRAIAPVALYIEGWKCERGLIGAVAAVAAQFSDETWEMLVYRFPAYFSAKRTVDTQTLVLADSVTRPHTWDTYDEIEQVAVCVPHPPDPVLYGIRGDSPFAVARAVGCISAEPTEDMCLFRTNQGTDAHIIDAEYPLKEGCSYKICGTVMSDPVTGVGGHVRIEIACENTDNIPCMAYEPTKSFRTIIRSLIPGDTVEVYGSYVRRALNLEKIHIICCQEKCIIQAPMCEECKKRMTSNGTNKGYKCRKCGAKTMTPDTVILHRDIEPGWYEVSSIARRHLAKPLIRGI
jgi:tRNA(Ile2)-agmatinylcytidine synthase